MYSSILCNDKGTRVEDRVAYYGFHLPLCFLRRVGVKISNHSALNQPMKCGLCGLMFDLSQAEQSCSVCPLVKDCRLIRCPRCGYEMPPEAKLVRLLRRLRSSQQTG